MKTFEQYLIEERLEEMSTIVMDKTNSVLIQVNPDRGRMGLEYFKFFNSFSEQKSNKMARISFREPRYVIHHNNRGKDLWELNSKEKRILMFLLKQNSNMLSTKGKILTNWEKTIIQFNMEKGLSQEDTEDNFIDTLNYPDYLPIDLPMPDYTKLS